MSTQPSIGYGVFDAQHLAAAKSAGSEIMLSTDDRLIRRAQRKEGSPRIPVRNPNRGQRSSSSDCDQLADQQFERHALEVLKRELGANGLARFLRLNRSRPGDYTTDRDQWQKNLTIDQILESINKNRS